MATPMDELRGIRQQLEGERTTEMDLPGYQGKLVARYGQLDARKIQRSARRIRRNGTQVDEATLLATMDALIESCQGLFYRNDVGELVSLSGEDSPDPMLYEQRLAEYMGFQANTAREVLLGVFGGNELALLEHSRKLMAWMTRTEGELFGELAGE
jgi:hypothetical protein